MLVLIYDLRCGFEDEYVVLKNREHDISSIIRFENTAIDLMPDDVVADMDFSSYYTTEEKFFNDFKEDPEALMDFLEQTGYLDMWYESSVLDVAHRFFAEELANYSVVPGIWEPSNIKLVYKQDEPTAEQASVLNSALLNKLLN